MFKFILPIILVFLAMSSAFSWDENTRTALFEVSSRIKDSNLDTTLLTETFQTALVNHKAFVVVEKSKINQILESLNLKSTAIAENNAVEVGGLSGAHKVIYSTISKADDAFVVIVKVVDVKTGNIEIMEQETAYDIDGVMKAFSNIAWRLVEKSKKIAFTPDQNSAPAITENKVEQKVIIVTKEAPPKEEDLEDDEDDKDKPVMSTTKPRGFSPIQFAFAGDLQIIPKDFLIIGYAIRVITGYNIAVYGVQHGFINQSGTTIGVSQGFINEALEVVYGLQQGFINTSKGKMYGAQMGFINEGKDVRGTQMGFINTAQNLKGVQIGFLNTVKDG